jgi:hypothetical protein
MLAWTVRRSLLLELAAYAGVGAWLYSTPAWPGSRIAAAAVAFVLGEWRSMVMDNYFYLPWERLALRVAAKR